MASPSAQIKDLGWDTARGLSALLRSTLSLQLFKEEAKTRPNHQSPEGLRCCPSDFTSHVQQLSAMAVSSYSYAGSRAHFISQNRGREWRRETHTYFLPVFS